MKDIIMTPCGAIRGVESRNPGVTAYKGIRYATAERWKHPVMVTHWDGVYEADHYGHCSYQPRAFYNEEENLFSTTMSSVRASNTPIPRTACS